MIFLMTWVARIAFFSMLAGLSYLALLPPEDAAQVSRWIPWDKASHVLAYYSVSVVGLIAFARMPIIVLCIFLFAQGALLEALQPYFGRTRDGFDFMANGIGLLAAALPIMVFKLRAIRLNDIARRRNPVMGRKREDI